MLSKWLRYIIILSALARAHSAVSSELTIAPEDSPSSPTTGIASASAPVLCGGLPTHQCDPSIARGRAAGWPEVWGDGDTAGILGGARMAPNVCCSTHCL